MWDVGFNPMAQQLNGFTTYIMNSDEKADEVIDNFENAINAGFCFDAALKIALEEAHTDFNDFTSQDQLRIKRKIKEISGSDFDTDRRYR